jgi:hypothetical protein
MSQKAVVVDVEDIYLLAQDANAKMGITGGSLCQLTTKYYKYAISKLII